jgi:hypothetical protein
MSNPVTIGRWTCEKCGNRFDRDKAGNRPIRFCTTGCYHAWNRENGSAKGRFPKGKEPWNKGLKGIHLSPGSEWRKGCESHKRVPVGTERIRHRRREKSPRAFVKVAEPNLWRERAVVVWETHHKRSVPRGYVIHHKDRNPLNDDIGNLQALSRADHAREHRNDMFQESAA